ncbi:hypothetical protein FPV67DRAFT_1419770 [Lyophyllum atratum]|nr:hypothetical protein FPV67DRAFT_1419770 [Lyophyllum atratum]
MPEDGPLLFWGNVGREGEDPQDFINAIERKFIGKAASDLDKCRLLRLSLKAGSDAHAWYKGLDASTTSTWDALEAAFSTKWPERVVAAKTTEEKRAMLAATVLRAEDIGKRVTVNGVEELSHIAWADKVERLADAIPDTGGLLISATRGTLPLAVKMLLGTHTSWTAFCTEVRGLSLEKIRENQEREDKDKAREEEQRMMKEELVMLRKQQQTPSKVLAATLRNVNLGPTPRFLLPQGPAPNTNIARTPSPQNTNPFYVPPTASPAYANRPATDRWADVINLALPIHPNTAAGKVLYEAQVSEFAAKHGNKGPNEDRPYPLSPGSSPVASGECWKCGCTGHMGGNCASTRMIPLLERRWRQIAASIKKNATNPGGNSTAVNLVTEGTWMSREEYNDHIVHEFLREQMEAQGQGNGEGSST